LIKRIRIKVDIDEIDGAVQAVHSSAKLTAIPFDILYGHHFHTGLVDQFLLKRIICTHANHHDVVRDNWGIKSCLLAKPIQTKSCGNGDGHPAKHPAERCFWRVAIAVSVYPDHTEARRR
jgi:hypothetical protein